MFWVYASVTSAGGQVLKVPRMNTSTVQERQHRLSSLLASPLLPSLYNHHQRTQRPRRVPANRFANSGLLCACSQAANNLALCHPLTWHWNEMAAEMLWELPGETGALLCWCISTRCPSIPGHAPSPAVLWGRETTAVLPASFIASSGSFSRSLCLICSVLPGSGTADRGRVFSSRGAAPF